jgi:nitrogen fixation protein FixH
MRTFIIITMIAVVAATVATIMIGRMTFEGTVVKDPYEAGLRWDAVQRKQRESGWNVLLLSRAGRTGKNDIAIKVQDRNSRPPGGALIDLKLERPSTQTAGIIARTRLFKDGAYHAIVDIPEPGSWTATILVSRGGDTVEFEDTLFVE